MSTNKHKFIDNLNNKSSYLFLRQFYNDPKKVLECYLEDSNKSKKFINFNLFLNNDLLDFLELVLYNREFTSKLDSNSYDILRNILQDSIFFEEMISVGNINYNINTNDLVSLIQRYDALKANMIIKDIDTYKGVINAENKCIKDMLNNTNGYFKTRSITVTGKSFNQSLYNVTVCKNEFLEVIQEALINGTLSNKRSINNIKFILDVSIRIKQNRFSNIEDLIERVGIENIKAYDLKKAQVLLQELEALKTNNNFNSKVIDFRSIKNR